MNNRENWLKAIRFEGPEWIPFSIGFAPLTWHIHRDNLAEVCRRHPLLFPGFEPPDYDYFPVVYREGEHFKDNWGCVWYNAIGGLEGMIVEHPLENWDALESYQPPDPGTKFERSDCDWGQITADIARRKSADELTMGTGERLFDRMYFLRGFENLMVDIATDDPHLPRLIQMLTEHELRQVNLWLDRGVDAIAFHTDIGTQNGLMIHPEKFRKYIKPMFTEIFQTCRKGGAEVALSSDGNLLEIVDDLIECGISSHDPQLRANTLAGIETKYKGRLCANVDLDRQMFAFCSPQDITNQVKEVVERMNSSAGGLMINASVWDGLTSLENIEALCQAIEDYCLAAAG